MKTKQADICACLHLIERHFKNRRRGRAVQFSSVQYVCSLPCILLHSKHHTAAAYEHAIDLLVGVKPCGGTVGFHIPGGPTSQYHKARSAPGSVLLHPGLSQGTRMYAQLEQAQLDSLAIDGPIALVHTMSDELSIPDHLDTSVSNG